MICSSSIQFASLMHNNKQREQKTWEDKVLLTARIIVKIDYFLTQRMTDSKQYLFLAIKSTKDAQIA